MEATYRGKKISDMTREELIEALEVMSNLYQKILLDNLSTNHTNS